MAGARITPKALPSRSVGMDVLDKRVGQAMPYGV